MGTTTRNFRRSIRMTITDLIKFILKPITEPLNRPIREISKDYEGGYVIFYTHSSYFYLPLQTFILTQYKYSQKTTNLTQNQYYKGITNE